MPLLVITIVDGRVFSVCEWKHEDVKVLRPNEPYLGRQLQVGTDYAVLYLDDLRVIEPPIKK